MPASELQEIPTNGQITTVVTQRSSSAKQLKVCNENQCSNLSSIQEIATI